MMCQAIDVWTFSELVGAFLNLAIAYFLLCGSALAYFASKFLGLFGLSLPCPCNGQFGKPDKISNDNCWQGFLVDCPTEKISNIQFLAKTKFPLDSILASDLNRQSKKREFVKAYVASEGETSCASSSQGMIGRDSSMKEGRFDFKGKVVKSQRPRYGIRRRRKGAFGSEKSLSFSSFDQLVSDWQSVLPSPGSFSKIGTEISEGNSVPVHPGSENIEDSRGASNEDIAMPSESNESVDKNNTVEKDASTVEVLNCDLQGELGLDGNNINTIRILEEALEEEHAARSALYLELEKERSAAATAADEAMAMILRLQEEKASIEMEARQYQRMIEEKSAYDTEEMNILKEIVIRREREKHFLEREVETLRQMFFDAETDDTATTQGQTATSSSYSSEDPLMMLQQISKSVVEKQKVKRENNFPEYEVTSVASQNYTVTSRKGLLNQELDEADSSKPGYIDRHPSLQEKRIESVEKNPIDQPREEQRLAEHSQFNRSTTQVHNVHEKIIALEGEKQEPTDELKKTMEACDDTKIIVKYSDDKVGKHGKGARSSVPVRDLCVYDVHVIGDELNTCNEGIGNNNGDLSKNLTLDVPTRCDSPVMDRSDTEVDMKRSILDLFSRQRSFSRGKTLLTDLRRNSMSAFDYERLKIDNEVGCLRERLKIVQEGREKLNFSKGHKGREKIQLQLLEDIASQLREIRQLTEPGKAARQASLPPLSTKVVSKKRRSRSISLVTQKTS